MALTYKESQLIKSTIPFLREHGEKVSDLVYNGLLVRYPDLNNTLNVMHVKDGRLARALTVVILRFAGNVNNISELIPKLERICTKHCTLGILPEHYQLLGDLIIETFGEVMGPSFTPEIKVAWTKAYRVLSGLMIGREKIIYKEFKECKWATFRAFRIDRKMVEADELYSFYLVPADGQRLPSFMPGQYVTVKLFVPEIGYFQTRQYSLSDAPRQGDYYRITVKRDRGMAVQNTVSCHYQNPGMISNMLIDRVRTGDEIEVSHPGGDFFLDTTVPSSVPLVLISAGGGVAPLCGIMNWAVEDNPKRHVTWIHGCRDDVPFETRLTQVRRRCPNVKRVIFKTALLRSDVAGINYDFNCRVDLKLLAPDVVHTANGVAEYYICGPESFMRNMVSQLRGFGVSQNRIKCELYSVGEMSLDTVPCA